MNIWDCSKIGDETKADENNDGPQELIFSHRGHKEDLRDASWNLTPGSNYIASVDSGMNHLEVWQPANTMDEDNVL